MTCVNRNKFWMENRLNEQKSYRRCIYSQVFLGSAAGLATGYVITKIGKHAAIIIGGAIILLEIANLEGCVDIDWQNVSKQIVEVSNKVERFFSGSKSTLTERGRSFTTANVILGISFLGGTFLGFGLS